MAKILFIGASGFLGTKLKQILNEKNIVIGTYLNNKRENLYQLDITDKKAVNEFFCKHNPEIVVHTAAMVLIDECEKNKALADKINYMGTRNIVDACRKIGAKLVYISTAYVFDGKKGNYTENDPANPINFYGKTKVNGEQEVLSLENSIIIRLDIFYGYNGPYANNGFFSKIIKGEKLELNNYQKRHPLLIDDAAHAIQIFLEKDVSGIYHLAGQDTITTYGLARALEKIIREKSCLVSISEKQQLVKRPENTSLDTSKVRKLGIQFHSLSEGIHIIEQQYKKDLNDNS